MFSLPKLLALGAIIIAVWYGFRFIGRLDQAHKEKHPEAENKPAGNSTGDDSAASGEMKVVDLVQDKSTGTFVADEKRDDKV